jgi:hypothetical protein
LRDTQQPTKSGKSNWLDVGATASWKNGQGGIFFFVSAAEVIDKKE